MRLAIAAATRRPYPRQRRRACGDASGSRVCGNATRIDYPYARVSRIESQVLRRPKLNWTPIHIPDGIAYWFQAQTYATGLAYRPSPPDPRLFEQFLIMDDGEKWFSIFPPGWPLVLALGMKLGAPWLVNPILGAIGILLAHSLVSRICGRATASMVVALLALSPTYLFMSASLMSQFR